MTTPAVAPLPPPENQDRPLWQKPIVVVPLGLWLGKKLLGRVRTHRRRVATKELRRDQRARREAERHRAARRAKRRR